MAIAEQQRRTVWLPGVAVEGQWSVPSRGRPVQPDGAAVEAPDGVRSQPGAWEPPPSSAMGRPREVSTRGDAYFYIRCHQQPKTREKWIPYPPKIELYSTVGNPETTFDTFSTGELPIEPI